MDFTKFMNIIKNIGTFIANYFVMGFRNLFTVINWVITAVNRLGAEFKTLTIPDWITPGSPTPLEMGLRGINDAMRSINSGSLPTMTQGLKFEQVGALPTASVPGSSAGASVRASSGMTVVMQFGDGVTRDEVHTIASGSAEDAVGQFRRALGVA